MRQTVFLTIVLSVAALSPSFVFAQPLSGRWIGVHTEWDINSFCPLPAYMDLNADNTWQLGLVDESEPPRTGTWAMEGAVLRLDTTHYAPELVSIQGDFLRIGRVQPMLFRRYRPVPMSSETIWQRLAGQVWQSDSVQYLFAADGRVGVRNRRTNEQTVHYAQLLKMGESAFLTIRGSANGREGNVRMFWQVVSNEVGVIKLLGGLASSTSGQTVGTETLRWVRPVSFQDKLQPTVFQACANCFGQYRANRYFGFGKTSEAKIASLFRQRYKPVEVAGQSGLISLSFVQNCAGERGNYTWQELDANYQKRSFDKRIIDQLQDIIRNNLPENLFNWDGQEKRDVVVSLNIRLVDGHITEVF